MSFSKAIKDELCKAKVIKECCLFSELYGILLFSHTFSILQIKIMTEQEQFFLRAVWLLKKYVNPLKIETAVPSKTKGKYIIEINDKTETEKLFLSFGYDKSTIKLHINMWNLEEDCCKQAFIKGAFLSAGVVTNPASDYHFEIITFHETIASELKMLFSDMELNAKITKRGSNYVVYFKDSTQIEDALVLIGAYSSSMELMEAKIEKEANNKMNREINCSTANYNKTLSSSREQIEAIKRLKNSEKFDNLPQALKEIAELRLKYDDISLNELLPLLPFKLSKSGLNHRLNKIIKISKEG